MSNIRWESPGESGRMRVANGAERIAEAVPPCGIPNVGVLSQLFRRLLTSRRPRCYVRQMNTKLMKRTGAVAAAFAISGAAAVACSQAEDATKDAMSSASSAASSAVDAGTSAAESASSAASSAIAGAPSTINAPGVGEVTLDGPTAEAFTKAGGEATLGLPTAQPEKVGDGTVQAFANGTIYSSPSTGAHVVQGEILRVYTENGGPAGQLGFPTTDEAETAGGPDVANGGWISEFQHGTITWLNHGDGTFAETITPK